MYYEDMENHFKNMGLTIEIDEFNQLENGGEDETTFTLYLYADPNTDFISVVSIDSLENPKDIQFAYNYFDKAAKKHME